MWRTPARDLTGPTSASSTSSSSTEEDVTASFSAAATPNKRSRAATATPRSRWVTAAPTDAVDTGVKRGIRRGGPTARRSRGMRTRGRGRGSSATQRSSSPPTLMDHDAPSSPSLSPVRDDEDAVTLPPPVRPRPLPPELPPPAALTPTARTSAAMRDFSRTEAATARDIQRERRDYWEDYFRKWTDYSTADGNGNEDDDDACYGVSDDDDWDPMAVPTVGPRGGRARMRGGRRYPRVTEMTSRAFQKYLRVQMQNDDIQSILSSPSFEEEACEEGPVEDLDDTVDEDDEVEEEEMAEEEFAVQATTADRVNDGDDDGAESDDTLTYEIVEPMRNFDLSEEEEEEGGEVPVLMVFEGARDEFCPDGEGQEAERGLVAAMRSPAMPPRQSSKRRSRDDGEDEEEEEDDRPDSPFYVPGSTCSSEPRPRRQATPPLSEDLPRGGRPAPPRCPISPEKETVEAMEEDLASPGEFFTPDEVHGDAAVPAVAAVGPDDQPAAAVREGEPLFVRPLACSRCAADTALPEIYWEEEDSGGGDVPFLCDACFVSAVGHADCEEENCITCMSVAAELDKRAVIASNFMEGTLVVEEDEEEDDDVVVLFDGGRDADL